MTAFVRNCMVQNVSDTEMKHYLVNQREVFYSVHRMPWRLAHEYFFLFIAMI